MGTNHHHEYVCNRRVWGLISVGYGKCILSRCWSYSLALPPCWDRYSCPILTPRLLPARAFSPKPTILAHVRGRDATFPFFPFVLLEFTNLATVVKEHILHH